MDFRFSVTSNPLPSIPLALRTVYVVYADPTYNVRKRGVPHKDIVALRTTGGLGAVSIEGHGDIAALPGTLLFFEHDKVRRYRCADITWDFWWFEFSTEELRSIPMNRLYEVKPAEREPDDCRACLELLGKPGAGLTRLASAAFSLLLGKWLLQIESGRQEGAHRRAIEDAIGEMRLHPEKRVTVAGLARTAGLCERRFRQVFSGETGTQPKRYRDALRMRMAEELLLSTPCSMNEIAQRLGYSSQFHFSKAFRSAHGVPPTKFRTDGAGKG